MWIESISGQFWWPSYLMSNLTSISVNFIMSIYYFLWTSFIVQRFDFLTFVNLTIWHLFDILTSFDILTFCWHFDIFFNLNHLSPSQGYFWNSTCSTALENFSGLEAKSSRSYSLKKIRWVVQAIWDGFLEEKIKFRINILSYNAQFSCSNISLGSLTVDTSFWLLLILMRYWKSLKPWTKKWFEILHGYK